MIHFIHFVQNFIAILSNKQFCLFTETIACMVAITISFLLIKTYIRHNELARKHYHAFCFLLLVIFGMIMGNFSWIIKFCHDLKIISIDYTYIQFIIMATWIFSFIQYQSFGLFIENLIEKKFTFRWYQKIILAIQTIFIPLFIYVTTCDMYGITSYISITTMFRFAYIFKAFIVIPSIIVVSIKLHNKNIPIIAKKQLTIFLQYIMLPHLFFEFIQYFPLFGPQGFDADISGIIPTLSTIFMTIAIIFCSLHVIRFRFLNFSKKVDDKSKSSLTGSFKNTIEHLSLATTPQELILITQMFFKENFQISPNNVCLNFRNNQEICSLTSESSCNEINNAIESFINNEYKSVDLLKQYRVLIADEIMFDAYYTTDEQQTVLANFLTTISSEIFLPMYDKNTIIGYLTINRSKSHKFYSNAEQNKIIIFGTFLASAINIMHNSKISMLLQESKKVKEDLYLKHQEVNQYKESIKALLKQKTSSQVGLLFYKNGKFSMGNEAAQKLLPINLNTQTNHPTTITLAKLAEQVESFRTAQTRFLYDSHHKQLMVTAVPHLDYTSGVIITIHYPDTADIIKTQIDQLQDPSQIDYLLYLETTKSGKLINQIIPSNSETFLNFKIKLLEISLHKKATLLQSHSEDLISIVEIIHHISLRNTLHILDLKPTASNHDLAIKLFGLNPILMQEQEESLLKKLDRNGTLFIKNVELLDLETQNKLAHFIKYGIFTMVKSEQKLSSDVRIICSVSQNPQVLMDQNKLSLTLYKELCETTLTLPSLLIMDEKELQDLIDGFAYQAIEENNFTSLLQISKKDKEQLIDRRPASLQEFKSKIQLLLTQKSKEHHIFHETHFDPEFNVTNPKLLKAANLGKHALKDAEVMSMLWAQFQCQSKIAQFLGVNRSSVNRRCKEYNLL